MVSRVLSVYENLCSDCKFLHAPLIAFTECAYVYLSEYRVAKGNKKFFETCRDPELVSELTIQVSHWFAAVNIFQN